MPNGTLRGVRGRGNYLIFLPTRFIKIDLCFLLFKRTFQIKRSKDNAEVLHHLGLLISKITWPITLSSEEKIGLIQKILIILGAKPKRLCSTAIKRGLIMLAISDWRCAVAKRRIWFQDTTRSLARQLRTKTESVSLTVNSEL